MVIFYVLWKYAGMAKKPPSSGIGARLDAMLSRVKPDHLSERGWLLEANVNTSFFTDLRNKGTVPSIDKVERLARVAGLSLAEFVSEQTHARSFSGESLRKAFSDALPLPAGSKERQSQYLADVVLDILGLPAVRQPIADDEGLTVAVERGEGAPPPASTKQV